MLSEFFIGTRTRWALVAGFDFLLDFSEFLRSHITPKETAPDMSPGAAVEGITTAELEGMPRTPWGLHTVAKISVVGAAIDLLVAAGVLHLLSLACEVSIYSTGRPCKNYYSLAALLLVLALLATVASFVIADAWSYALVGFAGVVVSIIATGIVLSRGYD